LACDTASYFPHLHALKIEILHLYSFWPNGTLMGSERWITYWKSPVNGSVLPESEDKVLGSYCASGLGGIGMRQGTFWRQ
jgi:hypothetical protein